MSTGAVGQPRVAGVKAKRLASKLGLIAFLLALAYLSVLPLVRLQIKAFSNHGQPYRDAFTRAGEWTTVRYTLELGLGSTIIALVLGNLPGLGGERPAAKTPVPEDPPDLSDHPAGGVRDRRLGVSTLARARLPECCAAPPPLVERSPRGTVRHLHAPVHHDHYWAVARLLRLLIRQLGVREHQR